MMLVKFTNPREVSHRPEVKATSGYTLSLEGEGRGEGANRALQVEKELGQLEPKLGFNLIE